MPQLRSEAQPSRKAAGSALSDESLITSKLLRELLGHCSEMHIWRLLNDEKNKALAFPRPFRSMTEIIGVLALLGSGFANARFNRN